MFLDIRAYPIVRTATPCLFFDIGYAPVFIGADTWSSNIGGLYLNVGAAVRYRISNANAPWLEIGSQHQAIEQPGYYNGTFTHQNGSYYPNIIDNTTPNESLSVRAGFSFS